MSARVVRGIFAAEADLLGATRAARQGGLRILDAFTPYAVHGLDAAMGLRPSRLSWFCFLAGATGLALALYFQFWTSAVDWPLNVGGKPFDSLPAFVPIAFEVTVLFAGLGVVFALFVRAGLWPGRRERLADPRVTDDRFVLLLQLEGARFTVEETRLLLEAHGAVEVQDEVREEVR